METTRLSDKKLTPAFSCGVGNMKFYLTRQFSVYYSSKKNRCCWLWGNILFLCLLNDFSEVTGNTKPNIPVLSHSSTWTTSVVDFSLYKQNVERNDAATRYYPDTRAASVSRPCSHTQMIYMKMSQSVCHQTLCVPIAKHESTALLCPLVRWNFQTDFSVSHFCLTYIFTRIPAVFKHSLHWLHKMKG